MKILSETFFVLIYKITIYVFSKFENCWKIFRYTNELLGTELNVFYSTPSCYLKSLNDLNISWPTKSDDFFPYASDPHSYWTGYFSSRPTLKFFERMGNNLLQASDIHFFLRNRKKIPIIAMIYLGLNSENLKNLHRDEIHFELLYFILGRTIFWKSFRRRCDDDFRFYLFYYIFIIL